MSGAWSFPRSCAIGALRCAAAPPPESSSEIAGPEEVGTGRTKPLVEHFDGARWVIVAAPALPGVSYLRGVKYVPGTCQVNAVGNFNATPTANPKPFGERYC